MANENDQQHHQTTAQNPKDCDKIVVDSMKSNDDGGSEHKDSTKDDNYYAEEERESLDMMPTSSKGKLNDLVADLCINGHRGYGDFQYSNRSAGASSSGGAAGEGSSGEGSFASSAATTTTHTVQPPPTQNSSFSFKHFLSSSSVPTAPSTTVTSLDPPLNVSSTSSSNSNSNSAMSTRSLQTSTGARPKVPQSNSASSTLTASGTSTQSGEGLSIAATKMKRSPRFSSFDSQASLAEYAGAPTIADLPACEASSGGGNTKSSDYRLYPDERERDRFAEWGPTNAPTMTTNSSDYDRGQYVPRSYSNYEIPRPQTSPRRRAGGVGSNRDSRPTRLTLNTNPNPTMAAKLKLDLPINTQNTVGGSNSSSSNRRNVLSTRPTDFHQSSNPIPGGAAAAAALPDFVQDHWMDSWYANDMHVNSPPSSPTAAFTEELVGTGNGDQATGACAGGGGGARPRNRDNIPLPGPADMGGFNMGLPEPSSSSVGSKMLPDFLSDGPIIHSSQRLADIATGLPSNSMGSPEDSNMTTQLSRLRSDNELLQRELNETRVALNEQTLRANNLERQLLEQQRQHKSQNEENLDTNKKHSNAVQSLVVKLKQQVQQLNSEIEILKREKDLMREEGAVGGCNVSSCNRSPTSYAPAATVTSSNRCTTSTSATAVGGGSGVLGGSCVGVSSSTSGTGQDGGNGVIGLRPSRAQQISIDLRRAASNAEQNLRQLLAGVDNLRQMAANIEKSETHVDYDASPDLFSDFIDDCDDYEECPGGPDL
ncbi:lethal (3) 04053 [Haematobia irritans]|uniref:lethal (3) 04053 n=1 Tax=Haematobia irritans TaxID=7368 RepID=UPI003F504439